MTRLAVSSPTHALHGAVARVAAAWHADLAVEDLAVEDLAVEDLAVEDLAVEDLADEAFLRALMPHFWTVATYARRRLVRDTNDAEDIAAEAIVLGWRNRKKLDATSSLGAWLCVVARYRWSTRLGKNAVRRRHLERIAAVYRQEERRRRCAR